MSTKKKDLEIIYSLQWKDNKPANGGDKANIIGMYDIPATTLNWEVFKSYLLKNSGAGGEDVKVSYVTDSNREFPIDSQTDFQIALYAFRRKARMGDIVNLKLERISDQEPSKASIRNSSDVQTQSDNNEAISLSPCYNAETPPDWFVVYMNVFKKEVKEDIASMVLRMLSNLKPYGPPQPSYHSRKSKLDSSKRIRKHQPLVADNSNDAKDILKSLKIESKLEKKIEKLECKTRKIREKKIALFAKSSDSEAGHSSSRSHRRKYEVNDNILEMDAAPVMTQNIIPHMLGGEIYLHQWKVMNTGKLPWTSETTLNYTWGPKALKPLDTVIPVPHLYPNQVDTVFVRLQVPEEPGQYECYFHFHHNERRFGHWLGCQIIVDPFDLKGNKSVLETSFTVPFEQAVKNESPVQYAVANYSDFNNGLTPSHKDRYDVLKNGNSDSENNLQGSSNQGNSSARNISRHIEDMKLQDPTDTNCSSDSDNRSIVSLNEGTGSRGLPEEFVIVPIPECFKFDNTIDDASTNLLDLDTTEPTVTAHMPEQTNIQELSSLTCDDNNNSGKKNQNCQMPSPSGDILSNSSQKTDIVFISLHDDSDAADDDFAYVVVGREKSAVPVPKKIIKSEYLEHAERVVKTREGTLSRASSSRSSIEIVNKADVNADFSSSSQKEQDSVGRIAKENSFLIEDEATREIAQPRSEFLVNLNRHMVQETGESADMTSHCSATGTCFSDEILSIQNNSRVFVFPEGCPGYELLSNFPSMPSNPEKPLVEEQQPTTTNRSTHPLNLTTHDRNPFSDHFSHVPNYQQTLPENRKAPDYVPIYPNPEEFQTDFTPFNESFASATDFNNTEANAPPAETNQTKSTRSSSTTGQRREENMVHILPETLVTGAVNVASTAFNTARSVINMIRPQEPGTWINGRWVSSNQVSVREANLQALAEMGFWNRDLNATLLARYNDDLSRVVAELVQ